MYLNLNHTQPFFAYTHTQFTHILMIVMCKVLLNNCSKYINFV